MTRRLGTVLAAAGLGFAAWGAAPATAAEPCTIDLARETIACAVDLAGEPVDCGVRRVDEPPFVTKTVGCGIGSIGVGCADVTYPASVGPPDGSDCIVLAGPVVCRTHLAESGVIEGFPGCSASRARAHRRAARRARRR